jgi:DNA-binding IscR family transcriptional regulator
MNLTKRGEYALRALIDIGIAKEQGGTSADPRAAERECIPVKFSSRSSCS